MCPLPGHRCLDRRTPADPFAIAELPANPLRVRHEIVREIVGLRDPGRELVPRATSRTSPSHPAARPISRVHSDSVRARSSPTLYVRPIARSSVAASAMASATFSTYPRVHRHAAFARSRKNGSPGRIRARTWPTRWWRSPGPYAHGNRRIVAGRPASAEAACSRPRNVATRSEASFSVKAIVSRATSGAKRPNASRCAGRSLRSPRMSAPSPRWKVATAHPSSRSRRAAADPMNPDPPTTAIFSCRTTSPRRAPGGRARPKGPRGSSPSRARESPRRWPRGCAARVPTGASGRTSQRGPRRGPPP